jgi:hypothetical protein
MDDRSRLLDIKPDVDMVGIATHKVQHLSEQIARFHSRMAMQLGRDASQLSAERSISELAEFMRQTASDLDRTITDGRARSTCNLKEGQAGD